MADETRLPGAETVEGLTQAMEALNGAAGRAGQTMTNVFARGVTSGKSFDTVLRGLGQRFVDLALQAALKPLDGLVGSLAQSLTGGLGASVSGAFSSALGGVTAFADGGVVAAPTYFGAPGRQGGGLGLMGEAGPEAIMPLARGADGRLGVRGGGGTTVNVTIQAQDAASFRRSEAQVTSSLARAVARGQRGL